MIYTNRITLQIRLQSGLLPLSTCHRPGPLQNVFYCEIGESLDQWALYKVENVTDGACQVLHVRLRFITSMANERAHVTKIDTYCTSPWVFAFTIPRSSHDLSRPLNGM